MPLEKLFDVVDAYTNKATPATMQTSVGAASGTYFVPGAVSPYRPRRTPVEAYEAIGRKFGEDLVCPYTGNKMRLVQLTSGLFQVVGGFDPSLPFADSGELKYRFGMRLGVATTAKPGARAVIVTKEIAEPPPVRDMPTQPDAKYMKVVDVLASKRKKKVTVTKE